jgi:hypothetical protein
MIAPVSKLCTNGTSSDCDCIRMKARKDPRDRECVNTPDGPGAWPTLDRSADVKTVPLHGKKAAGRVALVDDEDYDLVMRHRWWVWEIPEKNQGPYAMARIGEGRGAPRGSMHRLITGWPLTDHENHDGLDNRRGNLRPATHQQNLCNQRPIRRRSSRYKGVQPRDGRWAAKIKVNGKQLYLGRYDDEMDAALAYDTAARSHFGEFACPNFPEGYAAMVKFYMDGPHTPETVRDAADLLAEGIRYLNRATAPGAGGLQYPSDVDSVLGDLALMASRLPQLLGQISAWLQDKSAAGPVAVSHGPFAGDPPGAVAAAGMVLMDACHAAGRLQMALDQARQVTATMSGTEGGTDD